MAVGEGFSDVGADGGVQVTLGALIISIQTESFAHGLGEYCGLES